MLVHQCVLLVMLPGFQYLQPYLQFQTLQDLDAKIAIPMHFKTEGTRVDIDPIDPFTQRMGLDEVQPQPRLVVTAANLGTDMRTVIMTSQGRPR